MAKRPRDQWLLPTIVDRLIDDAGLSSAHGGGMNLRDLKESVRRDLENLLNTRRRWMRWPAEFEELDQSLYNYGIPDFTGANANSPEDVRQFLRTMEEVIRDFEPRFKSVQVSLPEGAEEEDRILRFRIQGLLHAEPVPEPALFDTEMEPSTGLFEVQSIS